MNDKYGDKGKIIFEMLKNGKSSKEIIETVGCTKSTISHYRTKLKNGDGLINIVDRNEVSKLVGDGLTTLEISEKLNCDRSTISKICKQLNIDQNIPVIVYKFNPTKEELIDLLNKHSIREIAIMNNVTIQTVYNKKWAFNL